MFEVGDGETLGEFTEGVCFFYSRERRGVHSREVARGGWFIVGWQGGRFALEAFAAGTLSQEVMAIGVKSLEE